MFEFECGGCLFTGVMIDGDFYLGVAGQRQAQKNDAREYE